MLAIPTLLSGCSLHIRERLSLASGITIGPPAKLAFSISPSMLAWAGFAMRVQPKVVIQDLEGHDVGAGANLVKVTAFTDPGCSVAATGDLTGATKTAVSGVAEFTDLLYDKPGRIYLKASSPGLSPACSSAVYVNDGRMANGNRHGCRLLTNGTARCWGVNANGALGDGTTTTSATPVTVSGLTGAVMLHAGYEFTCALINDGTMRCWGNGSYGQFGNGGTGTSSIPVATTISDVGAIGGGLSFVCAVKNDGTTWCWGGNNWAQLGDGTTTQRTTPVRAGTTTNAVAIAGNYTGTCTAHSDGTARCWGATAIGDGVSPNASTPTLVSGVSAAVGIGSGYGFNCASLSTGAVSCWGRNEYGHLGDGTTTARATAVPNLVTTGALAVRPIQGGACALIDDGTVRCWGYNYLGQNGDNSTSLYRSTPVTVSGIANAIGLGSSDSANTGSLAEYASESYCALLANQDQMCWGSNHSSKLGDGTDHRISSSLPVTGLAGAVQISGNAFSRCALGGAGAVACWGDNNWGQLGDNSQILRNAPVAANAGGTATQVTSGNGHSCAILNDGTARCWGLRDQGRLGDGGANWGLQLTPVTVSGLANVISISAGSGHTCAVVDDGPADGAGTLHCWGANDFGQVGDGTTTSRAAPVSTGLANAVSVSAGTSFTCAVLADGTARCWGYNYYGTLGDNQACGAANCPTPVTVSGLAGATQISAGIHHACARLGDGTAWCWGNGTYGRLGQGTQLSYPVPTLVPGLANVLEVRVGNEHSCALVDDGFPADNIGSVRCWGRNSFGEVGDGTTTQRLSSVPTGITDAVSISSGFASSCAVRSNGLARCWGWMGYGALGDGGVPISRVPVLSLP